MITHWHVGFGHNKASSHEVIFDDIDESVTHYLDLCCEFFPGYMKEFGRLNAEVRIREYAEEKNADFSFAAVQHPWAVIWTPCDGCSMVSMN
jgi:hypothetical protein